MFFYPEDPPNDCCRGCGTIGVNRRTCAQCRCIYCKSEKHSYLECLKVKRKSQSGTHKATAVLAGESPCVKSEKHVHVRYNRQDDRSPERTRFERSTDLIMAISQSSTTTKSLSNVFPGSNDLFEPVIDVIRSSDDRLLQDYNYFVDQKFVKHDELVGILTECIDVEIQNLRGKSLIVEAMQEVKGRQSLSKCMCNGAGGYLDFVTDVRDHDYLKFCVGQSVDVAELLRRHCSNLFRGEGTYLHDYMCALAAKIDISYFKSTDPYFTPHKERSRHSNECTRVRNGSLRSDLCRTMFIIKSRKSPCHNLCTQMFSVLSSKGMRYHSMRYHSMRYHSMRYHSTQDDRPITNRSFRRTLKVGLGPDSINIF